MKAIVLAIFATALCTGCLFSKKEEAAPAADQQPAAQEQQAPAPDANANNNAAPAEPAPAE